MITTNLTNLFTFIGGLGLFLYGMHLMSENMQKLAGPKFATMIATLTNNKLLGILIGALFTALINSSAATTVIVIGFVNAGLMTLNQAVGLIMGANVGTTITSWLVSLTKIGENAKFINPTFYAPLFVGIAVFFIVFNQKEKIKTNAYIALSLGLLFMGLDFMKSGIAPYSNSKIFIDAFALMSKNLLFAILVGMVVTAILQSSAASVAILQTLSMSGIVNRCSAYCITMGQNIGTCLTAIVSSMGGNRNGKRAAMIHLLFNLLGTTIFFIFIVISYNFLSDFYQSTINSVDISLFHTGFNLTNAIIFYPISDYIVKLTKKIITDAPLDPESENLSEKTLLILDKRFLEQPSVALTNAKSEVIFFAKYVRKSVMRSIDLIIKKRDDELIDNIFKRETEIDSNNRIIVNYLTSINKLPITNKQHMEIEHLISMCSDIERMGDHAESIAKNAITIMKEDLVFSDKAINELKNIGTSTLETIDAAIECIENPTIDNINKVRFYEDTVDELKRQCHKVHMQRLSNGECYAVSGIVFLEVIGNLERVADHANNFADYINEEIKN